jgi:hypothetical protein
MPKFTFKGAGGERTVTAPNEAEARHLAMVERWGPPNGRPALDTGPDGRYLSVGLDLASVED